MSNREKAMAGAGILAAGLFTIYGLLCLCFGSYQIPPGHKGVVMTYGKIESVEDEGLVVLKFWKSLAKFPVAVQAEEEDGFVPTKEGLSCQLQTSLLFRIRSEKVADLYREVGLDYQKKIVERSFQSAIRMVTAKHTAETLYSGLRDQIEGEILTETRLLLDPYGIICEQVLMKAVHMPDRVRVSIEMKQAADQDNQRMEFTLKQAKQEADRKAIEAKGIADAQTIIKKDLDENYLKYLWIKALETCAQHNNAVIYVPTGQDGMPIFSRVREKHEPPKDK